MLVPWLLLLAAGVCIWQGGVGAAHQRVPVSRPDKAAAICAGVRRHLQRGVQARRRGAGASSQRLAGHLGPHAQPAGAAAGQGLHSWGEGVGGGLKATARQEAGRRRRRRPSGSGPRRAAHGRPARRQHPHSAGGGPAPAKTRLWRRSEWRRALAGPGGRCRGVQTCHLHGDSDRNVTKACKSAGKICVAGGRADWSTRRSDEAAIDVRRCRSALAECRASAMPAAGWAAVRQAPLQRQAPLHAARAPRASRRPCVATRAAAAMQEQPLQAACKPVAALAAADGAGGAYAAALGTQQVGSVLWQQ